MLLPSEMQGGSMDLAAGRQEGRGVGEAISGQGQC